ncbi:MAG: hypothetical protein VKK04_25190 [Synechococcales bacterium]|nr:hypothetical protein [Synechococcales bacterium]
MKRFRPEWRRTIVHPLSQLIVHAVEGFSGKKGRRRVQSLEIMLISAQVERDRLRAEIRELVQYTDAEIAELKLTTDQLRRERDELQMQVWLLEEELEQVTASLAASSVTDVDDVEPVAVEPGAIAADVPLISITIAEASEVEEGGIEADLEAEAEAAEAVSAILSRVDLSSLRLALVGGHPSTRRGVIQELRTHHGLKYWVEIPRITESNTNRTRVKSKICRCNLVVLITGYMSHRLTEIVFSLKEAGSLAGDVLQLNCRGKSGVVREILNYVTQGGDSLEESI